MTETEVIPAQDDAGLDGPRAWCHVMYLLHGFSAMLGILTSAWPVIVFASGWPSIIAVIINYVTRDKVRGTWLASHWRWQMRTFWFAVVWMLVTGLLFVTIIGIPLAWVVAVSTGLWVLYRVIRGWLVLLDRRGMPVPVVVSAA